MSYPRTDLAVELHERIEQPQSGILKSEEIREGCKITRIHVKKKIPDFSKLPGVYVTIRLPNFLSSQPPEAEQAQILADELTGILPEAGAILVLGLGNAGVTPDALGPRSVQHILTTRGRDTIGGMGLREVCTMTPGVFAQTGLEAYEILSGLLEELNPAAVIAIDALAAGELSRLGNTIQLCDTGISPGSGVENTRPELSFATLGVPVIAVGVPMVIDYIQSSGERSHIDKKSCFVTPRDIDLLTERASRLIALGINISLQPKLSVEDLVYLTA